MKKVQKQGVAERKKEREREREREREVQKEEGIGLLQSDEVLIIQ